MTAHGERTIPADTFEWLHPEPHVTPDPLTGPMDAVRLEGPEPPLLIFREMSQWLESPPLNPADMSDRTRMFPIPEGERHVVGPGVGSGVSAGGVVVGRVVGVARAPRGSRSCAPDSSGGVPGGTAGPEAGATGGSVVPGGGDTGRAGVAT